MECRKHDYHNNGVCPSCLREKLSCLNSTNNIPYYANRLSPSPPSSSSSFSAGDVFPAKTRTVVGHHQRVGSMSFAVGKALKGNNNNNLFDVASDQELRKSRSMAFFPRDYLIGETKSSGGMGMMKKNKKKKNSSAAAVAAVKKLGFWTKLFPFRGNGAGSDERLVHARQRLYH